MQYLNKKARYAISSKKTKYIISKQEGTIQYNTIQYLSEKAFDAIY